LERRGLVVELGRFAKHRRKSLVVYASAKGAAEWAAMAEAAQAYFDRKACQPAG
jgi:hypothetical protein